MLIIIQKQAIYKINNRNCSGQPYRKMHQITIQKLATMIPRTVECWSVDDVCTWLNLNQVQIDTNKIKQLNLDGISMMKINPNQLIQIGATKFMARRIVQWLEEDASQFNQFLDEQADDDRPNALSLDCQMESVNKEEGIHKQLVNENHNNSNKNDYFLQKPKSQQNLPDQLPVKKRKISFNEDKSISNNNEIQLQNGTQSISELQSSLSSYEDNEDKEEITSLKNQVQCASDKQSQLKKIKLERVISDNCEVTDRLQRKNENKGVCNGRKGNKGESKDRRLESQQQQQSKIKQSDINEDLSIVENESMNVAKWLKKKKDDSKAFNQRLKTKSKQLNIKNPKLYNYLSSAHIGQTSETSTNQNQNNKVANFKKVASVQQIPSLRKMNMQLNNQQRKDKVNDNILIANQIIENPNVKFVSSQFMPYNPYIGHQNYSNVMVKPNLESFLRMVKPDFQKIITGITHAKVGRLMQNQFVLVDQSVSRTHAQIIPQLQDNGTCSYCIRDLGSKFGTFVECRAIQTDIVGKSYLIGDAQIQIISLQPSKHPTKKQTFDLKVRIDKQKQLTLLNRSSVSIGKKLSNDIKIEQNCTNARIWVQKGKFYIQGIEGKIFVKLKQQEIWDINSNIDINSGKVQIVFGCCRVGVEVGVMCFVCRGRDCGCLG